MTAVFPGLVLPSEGLEFMLPAPSRDGFSSARIGVRYARTADLVDAYPAGTHDRELVIEGDPTPAAVADATAWVFDSDRRCRRVVLPVPEGDLDAISWAEDAGFRYVVDVQTRRGDFSLLVAEPEWVLAQPHILDEIPLKE